MVFLKEKDMPTAPLEDLRYSKKRCDYLRNLTSGLGVAGMILNVFMVATRIPQAIIVSKSYQILILLLVVLSGGAGAIFSVLAKEEQKFFIPAAGCVIVYGILSVVSGNSVGIMAALLALIFLPVARHFYYYNEKLKEINGYPAFNRHEEHRKFEAVSRTQALESIKNGGIVDADSFFEKDFKEFKQELEKEPDKTDWLRD